LAGSIVGSGELIATTRTGAEAGYSLLWLIIIGCVIKVFTQVEISRHCITHGETTVRAMHEIPKVGKPIAWFWLFTFLVGLGQLGGIIGGVGQALQIAIPLHPERGDEIWASAVTAVTIFALVRGGFGFIEIFCVALVGTFTFVTVGNLLALQTHDAWAISAADLREGLSFGLPDEVPDRTPLITAIAAFGIIGVGASELVSYPYWCLEKGYGRWTGKRDNSPEWADRARGWIRVLQWDAWGSMVVYTISTVAFFLLGAAVLHPAGLIPESNQMISTLTAMYEPVFGTAGKVILLVGAVAVLFSTFFVSSAQKARLMADALGVFGIMGSEEKKRQRWVKIFSFAFPLTALLTYTVYGQPARLILFSGLIQSILLPMMGLVALYFRWKTIDPRLKPHRWWDVMLVLSFLGFLTIGVYLTITKGRQFLGMLNAWLGAG